MVGRTHVPERMIVGWQASRSLRIDLALDASEQAISSVTRRSGRGRLVCRRLPTAWLSPTTVPEVSQRRAGEVVLGQS